MHAVRQHPIEATLSHDPFSRKLENIFAAVSCEEGGYILEAIEQYTQGIRMLRDFLKEQPSKQAASSQYIESYETRLKVLRNIVFENITNAKLIERRILKSGERGNSYYRILGSYFDDEVKEVHIYEPKLFENFQLQNLICFLETIAKNCRYLKYVRVFTQNEPTKMRHVYSALEKIVKDLRSGNVYLIFRVLNRVVDPKIIFGNGVIIHINHGLHFFQEPCSDDLCLGSCDYDFRKSMETKIEAWKSKPFIESLRALDSTN